MHLGQACRNEALNDRHRSKVHVVSLRKGLCLIVGAGKDTSRTANPYAARTSPNGPSCVLHIRISTLVNCTEKVTPPELSIRVFVSVLLSGTQIKSITYKQNYTAAGAEEGRL